jgi:hypothetical protein
MNLKGDILNTNKRPIYNQKQFQSEFALEFKCEKNAQKQQTHENNNKKQFISCLHPRYLLKLFTIVDVLLKYEFKKNFIADLFSGLTGNEIN